MKKQKHKPRWPSFVVRLKCKRGKHPAAYPIEVIGMIAGVPYWAAHPRNIWSCQCGKRTYEHKAYA